MTQFVAIECLAQWADENCAEPVTTYVATAINPATVALVQPHPRGAPLLHPDVTGQVALVNGQTFAVRGDISTIIAALEHSL
jgi:hypothetical protein